MTTTIHTPADTQRSAVPSGSDRRPRRRGHVRVRHRPVRDEPERLHRGRPDTGRVRRVPRRASDHALRLVPRHLLGLRRGDHPPGSGAASAPRRRQPATRRHRRRLRLHLGRPDVRHRDDLTTSASPPSPTWTRPTPAAAQALWSSIDTVTEGLGGGNELVGGLWILLVSLAAWGTGRLPTGLNVLGGISAVAGLITLVPGLSDVGMIFGLGSIAWFAWTGICPAPQSPDHRSSCGSRPLSPRN
jgi:hypothetical protein